MAALIFGATVAAFVPAFGAGFVNFDDDRVVLHNPYLRAPLGDALGWMWSTFFIGHYQPLTWMSLFVDARAGQFAPLPFHLMSVMLHATAAVLLFFVLLQLVAHLDVQAERNATIAAAAVATLFWSIHPLRVESVAWISERRDPLSLVFLLLALLAYLKSVGRRDRDVGRVLLDPATPALNTATAARTTWLLLSIAFLAASLLAKAWGMSFVVVLLAIDWAVLRRRALAEKIPFAVLGFVSAVVAWMAQRSAPDTMVSWTTWGLGARVLQACYGLCFYIWKTIWPSALAPLYELPSSVASWPFAVAAVMVMLAAALLIWRGGTYRGLTAAAVAYAAILAPVLGFAQSGPQLVADRYAYVAGILFSVVLATALVLISRRVALRWLIVMGVVVLAGYGAATWHQSTIWHDSTTLWSHAIESGHASYRAHLDLGQALRADGRLDDALAQYQRAVELRPESGNAWYVYANAMKAKGALGEAEAAYQRAIAHSTAGSAEWLLAHVNLGNLYYSSRRLDAALGEYRAAVAELDRMPADRVMPEPYLYLGFALIDRGDADGARRALSIAARYPSTRDRAERELRRLAQ